MRRSLGGIVLAVVTGAVLVLLGLVVVPPALAEEEQGVSLQGTLTAPPDRDPVPGVTVEVESDGESIGSAETDDEGQWELELPGPGSYDAAVDADTLPDHLVPNPDTDGALTDIPVRPGESKNVILQVEPAGDSDDSASDGADGDGAGTAPADGDDASFWDGRQVQRVGQVLVEGVRFGAIIAITAVGLSLIFGTTRMINFAHGEFVTLGAMTAFFLSTAAIGPQIPLVVAAVLTIVVGAGYGWAMNSGIWRPLRSRGTGLIQMFIISIGLSLLVRHLILFWFGSRTRPYREYSFQNALEIGPVSVTPRDLFIIVVSLVVLVAVGLMLAKTSIGKAMRAVADNRDLAESSGIDVSRVVLVVWMFSGALGALGGVFFGLTEILAWDMGFKLLLLMFAAVILGGLGTAYGAMVGGLVIGLVAKLSTLWFSSELEQAWALLVLIVVLLVRPRGILGRSERVG